MLALFIQFISIRIVPPVEAKLIKPSIVSLSRDISELNSPDVHA